MRRGPRGARAGFAAVVLLATAAEPGCGLQTTGLTVGDDLPDAPGETEAEAETPEDDAGEEDGAEVGCTIDEDCNGFDCRLGIRICVEGVCEQLEPLLCPNDGVGCTRDYCDTSGGSCLHGPMDLWCGGGMSCNPALGCVRSSVCTQDADCSLGTACEVDRCLEGGTVCFVDGPDRDGDTFTDEQCVIDGRSGSDCNDADRAVRPDRSEVCGNRIDDDCDHFTDYLDTDTPCARELGNDLCANAVPLLLGGSGPNEVPVMLGPDLGAEGPASACPYEGGDVWYALAISETSDVTLDTAGAAFDTVISLVNVCDGTELLCNDNRVDDPSNGSRIVYRALEAGSYRIRVGANAGGGSGSFLLHYAVAPTFATSCGSQLDATEGGTYLGFPTDASTDVAGCTLLTSGYKERFVVDVPAAANLTIATAGTTFPHLVYVRDTCDQLSFPTELLCASGPRLTGTTETLPDFIGNVSVTIEFERLGLTEEPPDGPYVVQINP